MRRIARALCVLPLAWGSERLVAQGTPRTPARPAHAAAAAAPTAPAPPDTVASHHLSGAIGVAVDSVHGTALAGAVVIVSGTTRQAVTDSLGQFRIDSVPPGTYQLGLFHPLLDSIGLALATAPVSFPPGRYAVLKLATPSPTALVNLYCPAEKRITGPSAMLGRVLDADTDAPSVGARVSLTWNQVEVGRSVGLRRMSRVRAATVDSSGSFQICGLPDNLTGVLRASNHGLGTAGVPVKIEGQLVTLASLHVPIPDTTTVVAVAAPAASDAPASPKPATPAAPAAPAVVGLRRGHAVATGRVVDQTGKAVVGAEISVAGAEPKAVTNDSGTFTLAGLPSGTQELDVRKVSYAPMSMPVDLTTRAPRVVTILMRPAPPTLAKVNVEASKVEKELNLVGFTDRKKMGLGHFMTEDQIAEKDPQIMTDIFTTMPGIQVNYSSGQPVLTSSRTAGGGCVKYYVDDVPYSEQTPGDINDYMRPEEVSAVEVYNSVDVPAQYTQAGNSSCAVIVIWTKTKIGG